jgi:hypothetical protein
MPQLENPLPGMNPFLELRWSDAHSAMIGFIREALSEELPINYSVRAEENIAVAEPGDARERHYRPDISIRESWRDGFPPLWQPEGGIAVAEPEIVVMDPEVDRCLEIRDEAGHLITAIEILSPRNKEGGGRSDYLAKQRDYLEGGVNLVEIDLLRGSQPTVAARRQLSDRQGASESIVCVTRAGVPTRFEIYRVPFREPIPAFRVPLRETDSDVPLALQPLIDRCYKTGRYWQISQPERLKSMLNADDLAWVEAQIGQNAA